MAPGGKRHGAQPRLKAVHRMMTVTEFLGLDLGADCRWELVDGEPVAHAAPRPAHGTLQAALTRHIGNRLEERNDRDGSACRAMTEAGIPTPLDPEHNFRVADIAATCEPHDPDEPFTRQPFLIVEVLSPDEEPRQRAKLQMFSALASVREILFLDSRAVRAELHRRKPDGTWPSRPDIIEGNAPLRLDTIGLEIPLSRLYRGLNMG